MQSVLLVKKADPVTAGQAMIFPKLALCFKERIIDIVNNENVTVSLPELLRFDDSAQQRSRAVFQTKMCFKKKLDGKKPGDNGNEERLTSLSGT